VVAGLEAVAAKHRVDVGEALLPRLGQRRLDRLAQRLAQLRRVKDEAPTAARLGVLRREVQAEPVEAGQRLPGRLVGLQRKSIADRLATTAEPLATDQRELEIDPGEQAIERQDVLEGAKGEFLGI